MRDCLMSLVSTLATPDTALYNLFNDSFNADVSLPAFNNLDFKIFIIQNESHFIRFSSAHHFTKLTYTNINTNNFDQ